MKKLLLLVLAVLISVSIISRTQNPPATPEPAVPLYYADGTAVANAHIVIGKAAITAGADSQAGVPVTLTGRAAFTGADTYNCFVSEPLSGPNPAFVSLFRNVDGSHFSIRAQGRTGNTWQQTFLCVGN